ncbi:MAG: hypothetical protein GW876_06065 [Bacteroidetes bacterium]|nr:hypothetical protein [Bacteroidota bacterium]NCP79792.1 hypothetical protein [archaeon]
MKKPNQMTKCFYGCVIITLITIGFACCQNKSKTDKYNDEIKKIETGENLSKKDIEWFLNYLDTIKNINPKKQDVILASLKNYETEMDSSQKAMFENAYKKANDLKVPLFNPDDSNFNFESKDTLDNNMRKYLIANHFTHFDGITTDKLIRQCLEILVDKSNKGEPDNKILYADAINYLCWHNGILAYSYSKIISAEESKTKFAHIEALQILTTLLKAKTWEGKSYNWFRNFCITFDEFYEKEKEKNPEFDNEMKNYKKEEMKKLEDFMSK